MAAYIKFDGLDGEARDKDHKGWSRILSFDQPIQRASAETGSRRRRGAVVLEDIVVIKELDKAGPKLAESIYEGRVYPQVEIHVTSSRGRDGRVTYYAYELKNVQLASYGVGGSFEADEVPIEEFSLNFEEIKVTYTVTTVKGKKKEEVSYTYKVDEGR